MSHEAASTSKQAMNTHLERDPSDPEAQEINPLLKLALELGPLMVFFFANARGEWLIEKIPGAGRSRRADLRRHRPVHGRDGDRARPLPGCSRARLPIMPLVSGVVVFVFGALTLWLQDDIFIKMKPTIVNTLFGAVLLGGLALRQIAARLRLRFGLPARRRGLAQADLPLGPLLPVPGRRQRGRLARPSPTDTWVAFKVWGIMPITLLFTFSQMPLIMRHSLDEQAQANRRRRMDFFDQSRRAARASTSAAADDGSIRKELKALDRPLPRLHRPEARSC